MLDEIYLYIPSTLKCDKTITIIFKLLQSFKGYRLLIYINFFQFFYCEIISLFYVIILFFIIMSVIIVYGQTIRLNQLFKMYF